MLRLGSNWMYGGVSLLRIGETELFSMTRDEQGKIVLNVDLQSESGQHLTIRDNFITTEKDSLFDLEVTSHGNQITARLAQRNIGLRLKFQRLPLHEVVKIAKTDLLSDGDYGESQIDRLIQTLSRYCLDDAKMVALLDINQLRTVICDTVMKLENGVIYAGPLEMSGGLTVWPRGGITLVSI